MVARTMLAVLDNNNNVGREQATIQTGEHAGELRYNVVAPKGRKGWVTKECTRRRTTLMCKAGGEGAPKIPTPQLAKTIAREEKPMKEEVVLKHKSRFSKQ